MNWKKEIIKKINEISGSQSVYNIFADWIKMLAISISNTLEINKKIYEKREEEYKSIANKYTKEELMSFSEMCGILTNAFEEGFEDVLGDIYMNLQVSNKNLGQFFTPYWYKHAELVSETNPVRRDTVAAMVREIGKRVNVKLHPHKCRRTCATFALRCGMPIEQVSKMLGHESIDTTQIYLDLTEDELKQAHAKYVR